MQEQHQTNDQDLFPDLSLGDVLDFSPAPECYASRLGRTISLPVQVPIELIPKGPQLIRAPSRGCCASCTWGWLLPPRIGHLQYGRPEAYLFIYLFYLLRPADGYAAWDASLEDACINSEALIDLLAEYGIPSINTAAVIHAGAASAGVREASALVADTPRVGPTASRPSSDPQTAGPSASDATPRTHARYPTPAVNPSLKRKHPGWGTEWACAAAVEKEVIAQPSTVTPTARTPPVAGQPPTPLLYKVAVCNDVLDGAVKLLLNEKQGLALKRGRVSQGSANKFILNKKRGLSLKRGRVSQGVANVVVPINPQHIIVPNNHIPLPIESLIPVAPVNAVSPQETQTGGALIPGPGLPVVGSEKLLDRGTVSPRPWTPSCGKSPPPHLYSPTSPNRIVSDSPPQGSPAWGEITPPPVYSPAIPIRIGSGHQLLWPPGCRDITPPQAYTPTVPNTKRSIRTSEALEGVGVQPNTRVVLEATPIIIISDSPIKIGSQNCGYASVIRETGYSPKPLDLSYRGPNGINQQRRIPSIYCTDSNVQPLNNPAPVNLNTANSFVNIRASKKGHVVKELFRAPGLKKLRKEKHLSGPHNSSRL
ncbi:uncharacterized protein [Ambystoma mexicanum]|uniref:uncharacterized protein n=1 Tax=Ambystoma mexicanum TaxID=8296 RepID=UPI0037E87CD2